MNDLVIYSCGGLGREILELALDVAAAGERWNVLGFLDDNADLHGQQVHDLPVLGGAEWAVEHPEAFVVVAIGSTAVRRRVVEKLASSGAVKFATLVHPHAMVGRYVKVGEGSVVCAGSLLTTDIEVGDHVIVNLDCTVGHDAVLNDYVTVAPSVNVSGNVVVGEGCDLGTGSTIIQGKKIGEWSIVGAGAVVVKDLPANVTAVGAPAKPIKERPAGWHE